jgi:hypothetical protein
MRRAVAVLAVALTACSGSPATTTAATTAPSTTAPSATSLPDTSTATTSPDSIPTGSVPLGAIPTDGTVGYVGCSVSQNAVEGYERLGGTRFWTYNQPYGGGSVGRWMLDLDTGNGRYWDGFDQALADRPTQLIWWSICTIKSNPQDGVDNARLLLAEIRNRIPDAVVVVSAMPEYSGGHICDIAGPGGPAFAQKVVDQLIVDGSVLPGPTMGPLAADETRDGCHATDEGQTVMGRQLLDFFG